MDRPVRLLAFLGLCGSVACGGAGPRPVATRVPPSSPAPKPAPKKPSARAATRSVEASTRSAEEVVAGMRQGFRECYQIGLWNNPDQAGSVDVVMTIDDRGRLAGVTTVGGAGLDRSVLSCLVGVARRGSFTPASGSAGTIRVPLNFGLVRDADGGVADGGAAVDGAAVDAGARRD
jgi:hypothetical protein